MTTASQTPIRTFQDILDVLAASPELEASMRQHVLDEEMRQLPAAYQRLAEGQTEMQQAIIRLSAEIAELREIVARLSAEMAELRATVDRMRETFVARQDIMERRIDYANGHLARIAGSQYEQAVANIAPRIVRNELNFIAPVVTHRAWQFGDFLAEAVNSTNITDRQAADLNRADLVIAGRTPDSQPIYALAEISITIHDEDIRRAHRRAQILRATLDDHALVIPAAFGDNLDAEVAAAARVMGVHILIVPAEDDEVSPALPP